MGDKRICEKCLSLTSLVNRHFEDQGGHGVGEKENRT
jgi:hypothetical protein